MCGIILNLPWRAEEFLAACIQVRSLIKCLGKIVTSIIDEGCLWVLGGGLGDSIVISYRRGGLAVSGSVMGVGQFSGSVWGMVLWGIGITS